MYKIGKTKLRLLQVQEQISTAYRNGWTIRNLAVAHDTSPGLVRTVLIESGVPLRKPGRRKGETK